MTTPQEAAWSWFKSAPLPVVLALTLGLAGWVYTIENKIGEQDARLARMDATLVQVDTNVQTLLKAVLWEQSTRTKEK